MSELFGRKTKSRFPADEPLRNPGESLQKTFRDVLIEKVLLWVMLLACLFGFAVTEWMRYWFKSPPTPVSVTILFIIGLAVVLWRVSKAWRTLKCLDIGIRGEKVVGQLMEDMRKYGYQVFHDIPGDRGNVDHLLVGPGGVFVIETKTRSKYPGDSEVRYDGSKITVAKHQPTDAPVIQAKAAARQIANLIGQKDGVRPVVLFPGWYVHEYRKAEVWVLNEKRLFAYVRSAKQVLQEDEINSIANQIAEYVRKQMAEQL